MCGLEMITWKFDSYAIQNFNDDRWKYLDAKVIDAGTGPERIS